MNAFLEISAERNVETIWGGSIQQLKLADFLTYHYDWLLGQADNNTIGIYVRISN